MILYLYPKHNYYNRKSIRYETVDEYTAALGSTPYMAANVNFIANEGVRTSQIINYDFSAPAGYADGTAAPSYCLVCDVDSNILHRWWVVESKLNCYGQVQLQLLRDVLADFRQEVLNCPSFIKKGWINTPNDTAIFNNEDMTYNQIKTKETLLPDASKVPWYYLYVSKELSGAQTSIEVPGVPTLIQPADYASKDQYPYYKYTETSPYNATVGGTCISVEAYKALEGNVLMAWDDNGNFIDPPGLDTETWGKYEYDKRVGLFYNTKSRYGIRIKAVKSFQQTADAVQAAAQKKTDWMAAASTLLSFPSSSNVKKMRDEDGKKYLIGDHYYQVHIYSKEISGSVIVPNGNAFVLNHVSPVLQSTDCFTTDITGNYVRVYYTAEALYTELEVINGDDSADFNIPGDRARTATVPYDIIAIPAKSIAYKGHDGAASTLEIKNTDADLSRKLATAIIDKLPNGNQALLYDAQLLPYGPFPEDYWTFTRVDGLSGLDLTKLPNEEGITRYQNVVSAGDVSTLVFYVETPERKLTLTNPATKISVPAKSRDFKVANETEIYRLCSPNYNGQFEFSATKNGGVVSWNISITLKPYSPYIKIAPNFGRLYGKNFGDARGLVCGGDFSISQTSDRWREYELQNKNYQVMFDRQVLNMETNNSIQKQKERWQVAAGALSAAGTIGGAAGYVGGPIAGGIAGVAAGALSAGAGIMDIRLNDKLRAEALDYAKDQFGYQLQNIQALPYSLTKIGVQNNDYKDFPFVEYYTCSAVEKNALIDKIEYDGMTIMRIGYIGNFLKNEESTIGTYIQAKPIRLDGIAEDSHIVDVIAAELQTGVYII